MSKPGEHADVLRALGRSFDQQHVTNFEIINHDAFLAVTWTTDGSDSDQRAYEEYELEKLRAEGRALRQGAEGARPAIALPSCFVLWGRKSIASGLM